jgi:hypothetical protein
MSDTLTVAREVISNHAHPDYVGRNMVVKLAKAVIDLSAALEPFADFADKWNANPMRGLDDELYSIHNGDIGASFRLSDCKKARAALDGKDLGENTMSPAVSKAMKRFWKRYNELHPLDGKDLGGLKGGDDAKRS